MHSIDMGRWQAQPRFLGIRREPEYSPGKVAADAAILHDVARQLVERGCSVSCITPDDDPPFEPNERTVVFAMCQGSAALARLDQIEARGSRVVNRPAAIRACLRHHAIPLLQRAGLSIPHTFFVATAAPVLPNLDASGRWWVKRGDVHATEPDDVVCVGGEREIADALRRFRSRGVEQVAVQRHIDGEVFKFYATADGFFHCVDDGGTLSEMLASSLRDLARRAATALSVEVYGGDAVLGRDGVLSLIDLNDWPSYGPCRARAAAAIAEYLLAQKGNPCV